MDGRARSPRTCEFQKLIYGMMMAGTVLLAGGSIARGEAMGKARVEDGARTEIVAALTNDGAADLRMADTNKQPNDVKADDKPAVTGGAADATVVAPPVPVVTPIDPAPSGVTSAVLTTPITPAKEILTRVPEPIKPADAPAVTDKVMVVDTSKATRSTDMVSATTQTALNVPAADAVKVDDNIEHQSVRGAAATKDGIPPPAAGSEGSLYTKLAPVTQVIAALAVVVGMVFIARAAMRKWAPGSVVGNGKGVMEVLARYPLTRTQSLVLMRIGSQVVVLNQGKDTSQSVLVIHDQMEVANILGQIQGTKPNSISNGFTSLLNTARLDLEASDERVEANRAMEVEDLDTQLDEMAAAKRQLMQLRQQVRSVRESMPMA